MLLSHRLYHKPGSSVSIAIYDDRVEVTNSGTFPEDMTLERLLGPHDSEPQNPIIANVLYKSKVLESWGRGIGLMLSECRRAELPDPEFHSDGAFVQVVLRYPPKTVGYPPTVTPQLEKVIGAIGDNTYSTREIMRSIGLKDKRNFLETYLYPAIGLEWVEPLYPEQPKHPRQKYRLTEKGKILLKKG